MVRRLTSFLMILGMMLPASPLAVRAQDAKNAEQQKAQAALQEKAYRLLEQVVSDAQALKLPENRLRVQWQAGDLLWERDEARARALFGQAAAGIGEMIQALDPTSRQYTQQLQHPSQLRQEFINTVARRDPKLAYNFFLASRPPASQYQPPATPNAPNGNQAPPPPQPQGNNAETTLEMSLLAQIAASDPALALQNAEAALDKGQFPSSLSRMLSQLQEKDKSSAAKLKDKLFKKLRAETILSNSSAASLTMSLLRPGPRVPDSQVSAAAAANQPTNQPLEEAAYRELLDLFVATAVSAPVTPPNQPQSRDQATAQARTLINGLQSLLPQIDKYDPARSQAARQKMAELGLKPNPVIDSEAMKVMREGTSSDILQAAAKTSSPETQSMLYRQAASKAVSEGNLTAANQIAAEHLDQRQREQLAQEIERQKTLQNALSGKMEVARQTLATMKTDSERVNWLAQVASAAAKQNDTKLAVQFLDEARNLVARRVTNYQQFELQLRVARGYANVDTTRAFEMLGPGIEQLNELLAAAAVLSGFDLPYIFKEDELLVQGGGQLNNMVMRYGQELANLATRDFERTQTAMDRFQRPEARIIARLAVARSILTPRTNGDTQTYYMPPIPPMPPIPIRTGEPMFSGQMPESIN